MTLRDELLAIVSEVESKEAEIEKQMKSLGKAIVRLRFVAERVKRESMQEIKEVKYSGQEHVNSDLIPNPWWRP